ncbi:MAG: GNAT family N-acetyltransferase [Planctomycetes bacterium]|nr:GNAT family N-acetyltransferase [Planctomycetota bacterium]
MKGQIETMRPGDAPAVKRIFDELAAEIRAGKGPVGRKFNLSYSEAELREKTKQNENVFLVVRLEDKVVGFLLGRISDHNGSVHWVGIRKAHRNRRYGQGMISRAVKEFQQRGCYQATAYTYPELDASYKLFEKCGFKESTRIDEEIFGSALVLMTKTLRRIPPQGTTKRIVLAGSAGQGVKVMGQVLARILAELGKEVTLNVVYGAAVRGEEIEAELIYSDKKIDVPFIGEADIRVQLSAPTQAKRRFKAKEVIIEDSVCGGECRHCAFRCPASHRMPFSQISTDEFGSPLFVNMIALGRLLRLIGIDIEKLDLPKELPARFLEKNLLAIRYGYTFKD